MLAGQMAVRSDRFGDVVVITLDRVVRANAYDRTLLDEFDTALCVRCAVLVIQTAGDGAFCAGADLSGMRAAAPLDALALRSQEVFTKLARHAAITIAAVQGPAVAGGAELALACDFRVAGPRAWFTFPETGFGILPSAGGTTRLSRIIGVPRAKEMILTGRVVDGPTALDWGLVHRIAEGPQGTALEWAEEIARRDHTALRVAKELMDADESAGSLARERVAEAILYSRRAAT